MDRMAEVIGFNQNGCIAPIGHRQNPSRKSCSSCRRLLVLRREPRWAYGLEALNSESLTTKIKFKQETLKPGEALTIIIQKPGSHDEISLSWLRGFLLHHVSSGWGFAPLA